MRSTRRIETMVLPKVSQAMEYAAHETGDRLERKR